MSGHRCGWCLCPVVAGRCTHCGRKDAGRDAGIPEELAARLAARRQQLARSPRAQAPRARQAAGRGRRWLRWAAAGGLLAAAALYASTSGFFAQALQLSRRTGCDICTVYAGEHGAGCERFFIDRASIAACGPPAATTAK